MGRQSRQPTTPRLEVLARRATKSGAPCHPFPSGCCRKRPALRCEGSPGIAPAGAAAPCAGRFRPCNAFAFIALTGPRTMPPIATTGITLAELASRVGATLEGDGDIVVRCVGTLENAGTGAIAFLTNPRFRPLLAGTRAAAVIVTLADRDATALPRLVDSNPYAVYAKV